MRWNQSRSFLSKCLMGASVAVVVPATLASVESVAYAQGAPRKKSPPKNPKREAALKIFEEGKVKFEAGDFAGAYEAFKAADALVPAPSMKFRMAECLDRQGNVDGAQLAYESFLASDPRPVEDKSRIDIARQRIAELKVAPAEIKVTILPAEAAAAALTLDGAPTASPVKAAPGSHTIGAKLEGFEDFSTQVDVTRNEKRDLSVTLVPKPAVVAVAVGSEEKQDATTKAPTPGAPTEGGGTSIVPAVVTLSLAGAGLVVGSVFGGLALSSKGSFEDTPTQELFDETERNALIADMAFGVALTFGVTGAVLLLTGDSEEEEAPQTAEKKGTAFIAPWAGPTGAGAVGVVTF